MQQPLRMHDDTESTMRTHLVHSISYFLRVVRMRRQIVVACIVVALLLGVLYYATATRLYESKASLLVLRSGNDIASTAMTAESASQSLMPTYERLMTSAVVLQSALNRLGPEDRIDFESVSPQRRIAALHGRLRAVAVRRTNIIEVSYLSKKPETAVQVINAVVQAYLEFMETTHRGTAGQLIATLTHEKEQLEGKLEHKQNELLSVRQKVGDLGLKNDGTTAHPVIQRAISMNEALNKAQEKRIHLQGLSSAIQEGIRTGQDMQAYLVSMQDTAGRELFLSALGLSSADAAIQGELEKSILEDRASLRIVQEHLGPNHPTVQETTERIRLSGEYLSNYHQRAQQRLASIKGPQLGPMLAQLVQGSLKEAEQHEHVLRVAAEKAEAEAVRLNGELARTEILDHDVKWMRNLRDVLLNQIANIDLKQDQGDIQTAVVSEPVMSPPVWPRGRSIAALALFIGTAAGLAIVYILDVLDDRFRSPQEIQLHLGLPILALVQRMEDLAATGFGAIQTHVAPNDAKSEAFRTLRTALAFAGQDTHRLVVCSAQPSDGKTTVLANLGVSFANSGKRTLLIDADLRRPGLTRMLELRGRPGLSELLGGDGSVAEEVTRSIVHTQVEGLDVLPSGNWSTQAPELLVGHRFQELLATAEANYEQILIDTPPILATSDAATVSQLVDGVVLVLQPGKNQRRAVVRAAESFTTLGAKILGVVANCVTHEQEGGYYGYSYGYEYKETEDSPARNRQHAEAA